ncbi:glycosyltransferase [Candidatus Nitronereus thalassa]|uniref:Glycosyltransferase n=1 Tax=Candidatus Nitronereus thalassa TaxID=3020898 RepID=A0ABU3K599_9BACT|nr:glycosyltransferase [Candidatus Nitronereus thalassa]MDT7041561.1 glycosyltransferase [Candidatus Nitronereus thalassa]
MPVGIAIIIGQLGIGGAEQQLFYFLSGIDRTRFCPEVINLGSESNEHWAGPIDQLGINVWHVPRSLGRLQRILKIVNILRTKKVKVVHSWVFHTNPYAKLCGKLAGVPLQVGSMRENYEGLPKSQLLRWLGLRSNVLVTNSAFTAQHLSESNHPKLQVKVVPNGIGVSQEFSPADLLGLRAKLGILPNQLLMGSIGRLDHNKNHAMLVNVFCMLEPQWPDLRLMIIGEGPLRSLLINMAKSKGVSDKVFFPGAIPNAAQYLPAFDVCCLTSWTEGMPNLVMEAAAAKVPVVSTDCGGSKELIDHGVTGYLVSPNNTEDMAKYVNGLLKYPDSREFMGKAGREKMERDFGLKQMVMNMTTVYLDALAEKGAQ